MFTNDETAGKCSIPKFSCVMRVSGVITVFAIGCVHCAICIARDFTLCHDDFNLRPPDGVLNEYTFTWLGFIQYTHVTTDLPHHSKAPRVVLVQKQFVVGTASDLMQLPKNYKLAKVIFGDYERDEEDCGMTVMQAKMGLRCPRAYIEIPIIDVTPHPEYSRFGVGNSLALAKLLQPLRSHYMVPICLPTLNERMKKRRTRIVYLIDYISSVPIDFDVERMGKKTLKLFTHKDCRRHRMRTRLGSEGVTHVLCTSGCGVRPGAPIISHSADGTFELFGVAAGGAPCSRRSMRHRLNTEPPLYIDVYPYINWMINVVTAHLIPKPYPLHFQLVEGGSSMSIHKGNYLRKRKVQREGWRARIYVSGNACFSERKLHKFSKVFYAETFEVNANPPAKLSVFMKISAGIECTITCAKLLLPNRMCVPTIEGIGGYNISVKFDTEWFPFTFFFTLTLFGKNTTDRDFLRWIGERREGFW